MRAKYKIGTLIKTHVTAEFNSVVGVIETITLTATGVEYGIEGKTGNITEDTIAAAYREIKPRVARKSASGKSRSRKTAADKSERAQASA